MRQLIAMMVLGAVAASMPACSKNWKTTRHDPEEVIDFDWRWSDEDARQVYQGMVDDMLARPWIGIWEGQQDAISRSDPRPVVFVGTVANDTEEYIDTKLVTELIEEEIINSGRVRVVAMPEQRDQLRDERIAGQEFNNPETIKKVANELGADFILTGRISDIKQWTQDRKRVENYYKFTLELQNIETNEKPWIENQQIKKTARRN